MRVSRLVELLVRLQVRGGAPASELADDLGVSVRTVYRDVDALSAAGVPVYAEIGRHGGIRIDPQYRIAGLPRLDAEEARSVLFAAVPAIAAALGFDVDAVGRTLLPAMERTGETAARSVHERLHVEPSHWFVPTEETPALRTVATAVWDAREVVLRYRGEDLAAQPFGLILKGDRWYLLARAAGRRSPARQLRLFRLSRVEQATLREHRFDRPANFDLAGEWRRLRQAFVQSLPEYPVSVRVAPAAEPLLALLDEGRPTLPLPGDTARDRDGWALMTLRMESPERAQRQLLRLGAGVEVLGPAQLRRRMASTVDELAALYAVEPEIGLPPF